MEFKIVQVSGGLGNQMFQYAFAKSLQANLDIPVLLDITWFDEYSDLREFGLSIFNIDLKYANQQQIDYAKMMENKPKLIRSILKRLGLYRISNNIAFEYIPKFLKPSRLIYFRGCFQDPRYFDSISSIIKQTFTSHSPTQSEHKEQYKQKIAQILESKNSVFVHIRRGDYVGLSWQLHIDYQLEAIKYMSERVENMELFLFCEDLEFVQNLDLGYPFIDMTTRDTGVNQSHLDMMLMMSCKHGIIANSTYSWWAAYLINNESKIIIAPSYWLFGYENIICDDWIKLESRLEAKP